MTYDNRSTDGVTYNKIVVGMTASMFSTILGLLIYIYTGDQARAEKYQIESTERIKKNEVQVQDIKTKLIISYAHQQNSDARLEKFIKDQKAYWRRQNNGQ